MAEHNCHSRIAYIIRREASVRTVLMGSMEMLHLVLLKTALNALARKSAKKFAALICTPMSVLVNMQLRMTFITSHQNNHCRGFSSQL